MLWLLMVHQDCDSIGHTSECWWSDSKGSPVWRISAGKLPQREATAAIQGHLQSGSEGLRNGPEQMGNPDIWVFSLEAGVASRPPILKRPLSSRLRQRSHKSSKIREPDRGPIGFVFSVEGIVTLELASSATLGAVPSPPYRARYHSLSRLKDA